MLRPATPRLPPHRGTWGNPYGYRGGPASQPTEESGSYVPASAWLPLPILGDDCLLLELVSQIPILVIDYGVHQVNRKRSPLGLSMQQSWLRDRGLQLATALPSLRSGAATPALPGPPLAGAAAGSPFLLYSQLFSHLCLQFTEFCLLLWFL